MPSKTRHVGHNQEPQHRNLAPARHTAHDGEEYEQDADADQQPPRPNSHHTGTVTPCAVFDVAAPRSTQLRGRCCDHGRSRRQLPRSRETEINEGADARTAGTYRTSGRRRAPSRAVRDRQLASASTDCLQAWEVVDGSAAMTAGSARISRPEIARRPSVSAFLLGGPFPAAAPFGLLAQRAAATPYRDATRGTDTHMRGMRPTSLPPHLESVRIATPS